MMAKPSQPFGKRGRAAESRPRVTARTEPTALSADVVATIVGPAAQAREAGLKTGRIIVARSFRAALLAGFCVGFFNAALSMTQFSAGNEGIASLFGGMAVPLVVISLAVGIWSAARTTAVTLLITHRILAHWGWTDRLAYVLGGGAVAATYSAIMEALGLPIFHHGFGVELASGLAAGFFYRLFAGTVSSDRA
jgi:hypothetical protein